MRNLTFKAFLLVAVLLFSSAIRSQELSTLGKSFWVTFMENYGGTGGCSDNSIPQLKIVISCNKATTGTVLNPNTNVSMPFSIGTGGGIDTVLVPVSQGYTTGSESTSLKNRGLLITANDTVAVSAQNTKSFSCDATLVYPIEALGVDYRVISHPGDLYGNSNCYRSCFVIVATENNTVIDITPTCQTNDGKPANTTFSVTLNKGETYMVKAGTHRLDLSGTLIQAKDCKKIALFCGANRSVIRHGNCASSFDQLYEQMMPINLWGKKFIVIPTIYAKNKQRKVDMIRVVAHQNSSAVRVNGKLTILNAGQSDTFFISSNVIVTCNKPIAVCQYGIAEACDGVNGGTDTDPMMMWIPPVEQSLRNLTFVCENAQTINKFFLNVIVKTSYKNSFTIDGIAPTATWNLVTKDTSYSYIQQDGLSLGKHTINSPFGFAAVLYAYGDHGSYGFNAGSSIKPLSFYTVVNGKNSSELEIDSLFYNICQNASVAFDGGASDLTGVKWKWLIEDKDTVLVKTVKTFTKTYKDTGIFKVTMIAQRPTNGTCNGQNTIDDTVRSEVRVYKQPYLKLLNDTTICLGNKLKLTSQTDGDTNYIFNTNNWLSCSKCFEPIATPLKDTSFEVSATYKGCLPTRDTVLVSVRDSLFLYTSADTTICRGTSIFIEASAEGGLTTAQTVTWDHGLGTGLTKKITPLTTTTYRAILTDNCTRDSAGSFYADTQYITINVKDALKITMPKDTIVCEGNTLSLTASGSGGWPGKSYITWKNGQDTGSTISVTMGVNQQTLQAVLQDECTLPNDTGYVTVFVRPGLKIDTIIYKDPVCKNTNFSVTAKVSGGDSSGLIVKFYNTTNSSFVYLDSTFAKTSSTFTTKIKDNSNFVVRLNQTCNSNQILRKIYINIKDSLLLTTVNPVDTVCTGQSANIRINAYNPESNPVKFVLYRKNGSNYSKIDSTTQNLQANFNVTPSSSPIEYMIVGDDNCNRNDTSYYKVFVRTPLTLAALTDNEYCRNENISFTAVPSGGKVQSYKYKWTDLNTNAVIDSTKKTLAMITSNSMDLRLDVSDGCSAPVNTKVRIWVAPNVTDSLLCNNDNGCEPFSTILHFPKTLAQIPINPSFNWEWTFNNSASINEAASGGSNHNDINRNYLNAGNYTAKVAMRLNNNKICFSKTQNITVHVQAVADFSYLPIQIDIVEPDVKFTNGSFGANNFLWNFGDGGTDINKDPIHTFKDTGLFEVTLRASNSNNCNDSITKILRVLDIYRIFIPTAFSPNEDPNNPEWKPAFTSILTCEVTIYNRWGEQVYFSNDNTGKWDGTFNGEPCEQGVYYYHLKVRDNRKKWHYYSGTLTLLR
jgi:gliding motility-associated-like protein